MFFEILLTLRNRPHGPHAMWCSFRFIDRRASLKLLPTGIASVRARARRYVMLTRMRRGSSQAVVYVQDKDRGDTHSCVVALCCLSVLCCFIIILIADVQSENGRELKLNMLTLNKTRPLGYSQHAQGHIRCGRGRGYAISCMVRWGCD